jgi:hypothetical protein
MSKESFVSAGTAGLIPKTIGDQWPVEPVKGLSVDG